jgi:GcrA cell cycle regulator
MSWTDDRVDQLSRLWMEGRSASQIAATLGGGLTHNAVIGKIHRLGLAGRVKTSTASEPDASSAAAEEAVAELAAVSRRMATRVSAVASVTMAAPITHGATALAVSEAPAEALKPARVTEEVVVPLSLKVTIVELRESMCKWPIGDPSSSEFRYCGSPSHNGTPYCQHHGKLAYQPAQDRRRDRERERRPLLAR